MKKIEVVAGLVKKDGKFLVCQRREDDSFSLLWEFPGGSVEDKETKEEALKRELKEELGLDIEVGKLLGVFKDRVSSLEIEVHLYEVLDFKGKPLPLECRDFKFLGLKEIALLDLAPVDRKILSFISSL